MSHRSFQQSVGTPFHLAWNGEDVHLGTESAEAVRAVVDRDIPLSNYDRGNGVLARAKLIFFDDVEIGFEQPVWMNEERWEYDRERRAEDGNRMLFVVRRDPNFTSSPNMGFRGSY